jgi:hypothetical protein
VSTPEERAFQCPRCEKLTGRQERFAVLERDQVKVIVRCDPCRHRWSVIVPPETATPMNPAR